MSEVEEAVQEDREEDEGFLILKWFIVDFLEMLGGLKISS